MSDAKFTVDGSPFADGGADVAEGATVRLQLEDSPASDIDSCVYSVFAQSKGAPDLVLSNGGVADPATAEVTYVQPAGVHWYGIRCQTNGGAAIKVAGKDDFTQNTKERIVGVRSPLLSLRKILAGESTQYEPEGWGGAVDELVDALESVATAATPMFSFGAINSTTAAAAQNIPHGVGAATLTNLSIGAFAARDFLLATLEYFFIGDAANVAGQTVTIGVYVDGVLIPGASVAGVATTAGVHQGEVPFTPFFVGKRKTVTVRITPSALLTNALSLVQAAVG
jgi:hypothetical protein